MMKTVRGLYSYYFTSWMDSRPVHGLSTLPTTKSLIKRMVKENPKAPFKTIEVPRPDMWEYYNHGMGGTDLHDQFNKYYRTTVRCNKWPIRIFTHFITSCVTNSYILYKSFLELDTKDIALKDFIQEMLSDLEHSYDGGVGKKKKANAEPVDSDSGSDNEVADQEQRGPYKKR